MALASFFGVLRRGRRSASLPAASALSTRPKLSGQPTRARSGPAPALLKRTNRPFAAQALQFVQTPKGERALVLGLTWRAVVASGGQAAAQTLARQARATHYAVVGASHTVGYGLLPKKQAQVPERAYPAATLAARHAGGMAVFALRLSRTEAWLATVRNGRPSGSEELLSADDDTQLQALVVARCQVLAPQLGSRVFTDLLPPSSDAANPPWQTQPCSLAELLALPPLPPEQLQALPGGALASLRVPRPVLYAAALGLSVLAGVEAYERWQADQRAQARAAEARRRAEEEDPQRAWSRVWAQVRASRRQPSSDSLRAARQSLNTLPTTWLGWVLHDASCQHPPQPASTAKAAPPSAVAAPGSTTTPSSVTPGVAPAPGAMAAASIPGATASASPSGAVAAASPSGAPALSSSAWACTASYQPPATGKPMATNTQLSQRVPKGFAVQFAPPLGVSLVWSVPVQASGLDPASLLTRAQHALSTASAIQELMPLMSGEPTALVFKPLSGLPLPRRADGTAIAAPPGLALPTEATLAFRGPLRSMDALLTRNLPLDWRSLRLSYSVLPAQSVDLKQSALELDVQGVLYAKD